MKSTKTILIAALVAGSLIAGGSSLHAQDSTNTPPAKEHVPGMKGHSTIAKQLDLTDAQKPKVEAIIKAGTDKRKALREDTSLTPEEKKAKLKALQEDTSTQLKAVLTPEQFTKWEEITKKTRRNGPPPGSMTPKTAPQI